MIMTTAAVVIIVVAVLVVVVLIVVLSRQKTETTEGRLTVLMVFPFVTSHGATKH
jgi:hypothetical protein